jgi:hypothetical protein
MLPNHDPGVLELKAISSDLFDIAKAHFTYTEEGPCFVGWLSALERAAPYLFMPQQQNAKMTQLIGTVLSAAMQFLCAPRSRRERTVMLMKSCRCPYSQRSGQEHKNMEALVSTAPLLRRLPPLVFVERLLKLVEAACDVRFAAIHGRTMRIDRIRKRKTWPRSIEEILPYGPEDTVRGLLGWLPSETCYYGADPASVLRMVHLILRFTRPLTLPYVLTSHTFISKGIQAPLANACKTLESSRRDPEQPDYSAEQEAYDVMLAVMNVMDDLVMLWTDEAQYHTLMGHRADQLRTLCARARDLPIWFNSHPDIVCTRSAGGMDNHGAGMRRSHWVELQATSADEPKPVPNTAATWKTLTRLIHRIYISQRCASPECTNTFANAGPFRYCSGCKRVSYCSRRCQKVGWSHPVVPHRAICMTLRRFCEALGCLLKLSISTTYPQPVSYDEEAARSILQHFLSQTQFALAHSRAYIPLLCTLDSNADVVAAVYRSEAEWITETEARSGS